MLKTLISLYIVDLKGNVRKDSMRDGIPIGEKNTVFGIERNGWRINGCPRAQQTASRRFGRDVKISGCIIRKCAARKLEYFHQTRKV